MMTSEEMMFDLTKTVLQELIRSNTEERIDSTTSSIRRQKEIGYAAANLARHAYVKMVLNIHEINNYES